ncbi:MAG: hypothetical protein HY554_03895, partial [Elusimicrobia bacterium]|nr:hypothetical protein [Elusimicrobiota bacterium]
WQETRKELGETLEGVQGKLKAARQAVQASSATASSRQASAAVERAARLERFVRLGRGEHNVYLASVALRKADQALGEAGAALGAELPDLSGLPLVSGSYCATMCHDKVGVKVPPETVKAFGKTMPHLQHTQMMGCVKCHDIAGHKRVPLRPEARKTVCAECHPDWAK